MEPDLDHIAAITEPILVKVVSVVAEQYRLVLNDIPKPRVRELQRMISRAVADKDLLGAVNNSTTAAMGLDENLIEMKLYGIVTTTMRRFVMRFYISQ